jgi:glutathione transport system permease protein
MSGSVSGSVSLRSPAGEFWRRFRRQHMAVGAGVVLSLLILVAIGAPLIVPYSPAMPDYNNLLAGPSWAHPFGTDAFGRDILSRIIWGAASR